MLARVLSVLAVLGGVLIVAIMTLTTPSQAGPLGVLGLFIGVYFVVLSTLTFGLHQLTRLLERLTKTSIRQKPITTMPLRRAYYFGSIAALAPVLLIGMQSVSGVGLYELFLVVAFVVLGSVYVARRMP